ncbi:alpha/beta hydrolase [Burkholderia sp. WAC0059]|nr:alpha/beta hydrolase [Burkholderia sp. WAC0059]
MQWRRFGSGAPLVLVHGGHGNWTHWIRNVEALMDRRTVWVPDLPGYGDSDALPPDAGIEPLLAATLESLDGLVGARTSVDLAGFSFGGMVAATLACRRPVNRLALAGSAGHGGPRRPHPELLNWKKADSAAERSRRLAANLRSFMLYDPARADAVALASYEDACTHTRFHSRGISLTSDLAARLRESGAEALLIWGAEDVTAAEPETFSAALNAQGVKHVFARIPDAGHWVQYEQADAVNALLRDWFFGARDA